LTFTRSRRSSGGNATASRSPVIAPFNRGMSEPELSIYGARPPVSFEACFDDSSPRDSALTGSSGPAGPYKLPALLL
jgi:hypothetical protein